MPSDYSLSEVLERLFENQQAAGGGHYGVDPAD